MFQKKINLKSIYFSQDSVFKSIVLNLISKQNILLYVLAVSLSSVTFLNDINPFGMAFLASIYLSGIPIFGFWIAIGISTFASIGISSFLTYLLNSIIFVGLVIGIRFRKPDKKIDTAIKLGLSVICSGIISFVGKNILVYDLLLLVMTSICTVAFFIIFSNSVRVITAYDRKAFSKEELVGTSIMLAIAVMSLGNFCVYGFSVKTVISILIVLVLGWKNGVLVGAVGGISIGLILAIMGEGHTSMIASYAFSGLLAGILNKFGKIGVVIRLCCRQYYANIHRQRWNKHNNSIKRNINCINWAFSNI